MSTTGFDFLPKGCPCDDPDADAFRVTVQAYAPGWVMVNNGQYWDGMRWHDAPVMTVDFATAIAMARQAAETVTISGRTWAEHHRHRA